MEKKCTLGDSEKKTVILGDRWWPQTAREEGGTTSERCFVTCGRDVTNLRSNVGGVSFRNRSGTPSRKRCVVNGGMTKAIKKMSMRPLRSLRQHFLLWKPPPPPTRFHTAILSQVTRLTVRQSTAVQVSESTQITCGGYAIHHAGMGAGSVYVSGRHALSSRQWLGSLVQLGQQQKVSLLCGASSSRGGSSVQVNRVSRACLVGYMGLCIHL